ncbi:UDP-glycosyltransferase-like protein [Sorochytrium milnesiophthora]
MPSFSSPLAMQSRNQVGDHKHVLIVTAPFTGHLVPSIELAVQLIRVHGCRVSLAVSKAAVDGIVKKRQMVPSQYAHLLTVVPMDDGAELPNESKFDMMELMRTFELSTDHFDKMARVIRTRNNLPGDKASQSDLNICPLPDLPIDHIVVEMFVATAIEEVRNLSVPVTGLWPSSPSGTLKKLQQNERERDTPTAASKDTPKPGHSSRGMKRFNKLSELIWSCKRVVINTFDGLEDQVFAELQTMPTLRYTRLYTVGPLSLCGREPLATDGQPIATIATLSPSEQYATTWLDKQHAVGRPVVYISYGSLAHLVAEQVSEIAQALDKLKDHASFVWAMRSTQQAALPVDILDSVDIYNTPDTHTPRSAATVLVMGWAPQVTILSHPATAAFVSHCGWNSVVEAMSNGVPVVGWPLFADQHKNAEMVASAEVQMGVTIPGTSMTASGRIVCCDEVVAAIRQVLGDGKEPSVYARNAARLGQLARDAVKPDTGSSMRNLRSFIVDVSQE